MQVTRRWCAACRYSPTFIALAPVRLGRPQRVSEPSAAQFGVCAGRRPKRLAVAIYRPLTINRTKFHLLEGANSPDSLRVLARGTAVTAMCTKRPGRRDGVARMQKRGRLW